MTALNEFEKRVLQLIPEGIDQRVTTRQIVDLLQSDTRTIRETVNSLIKKGVPIVAIRSGKHGGLFIPNDDNERRQGLNQIKEQTQDMSIRIKLVESIDLMNWKDDFKLS